MHLPLILLQNANLHSHNIFKTVPCSIIIIITIRVSIYCGQTGEMGAVTTPRRPTLIKIK